MNITSNAFKIFEKIIGSMLPMATTTIGAGAQEEEWADQFFMEYVREIPFASMMGKNENAFFQVVEKLMSNSGNTVTVDLVGRLSNAPIVDDGRLKGNEEALNIYGHDVTVHQLRNGVVRGEYEQGHTHVDIAKSSKTMLKLWAMNDLRDDMLQALGSPNNDGVTAYASTSESDRDTWAGTNITSTTNYRILYGADPSHDSGDHSADLAKLTTAADQLDFDILQLAKRAAKQADRHFRFPVVDGRETAALLTQSRAHRDLKIDTESIHQNAGPRSTANQLFKDGDLMLDGVMVKEVPEIGVLTGEANGGGDAVQNYMIFAQALLVCWKRRTSFVVDVDDYENEFGVAIRETRGVEKPVFNNQQHGVMTIYTRGDAD